MTGRRCANASKIALGLFSYHSDDGDGVELREHPDPFTSREGAGQKDPSVARRLPPQGGRVARKAPEVAVDADLQIGIRQVAQRERQQLDALVRRNLADVADPQPAVLATGGLDGGGEVATLLHHATMRCDSTPARMCISRVNADGLTMTPALLSSFKR